MWRSANSDRQLLTKNPQHPNFSVNKLAYLLDSFEFRIYHEEYFVERSNPSPSALVVFYTSV
jgi:hypothetical protein